MKIYLRLILSICISATAVGVSAQDTSVPDLIKQGIALNSQKQYAEAADKYKAALAAEPDNIQANYQMAFTLFSAGKNTEALPFIEKATHGPSPKFTAMAYSLMGSIYQGSNQLPNAITAYQNATKADSSNQRIYYNLGIAYFKSKQYDNAQATFEQAIMMDINDAGSTRMYALSAFHQNKRADAILGFSWFLLLEPNSNRSAEAFGNLQNILKGGRLKPEPNYKLSAMVLKEAALQDDIVKKAFEWAAKSRYASPNDLLGGQLYAIFRLASADRRIINTKLAQLAFSISMPTVARYISQSAKPESAKWLKDNPADVKNLEDWMATNNPKL